MINPKLIWFALGVLTGGAIGSVSMGVYLKRKFTKEFEEAIDEMEEYYDKVDEYRRPFKDVEAPDVNVNPVNKVDETNTGRENGSLSKKQREEIKKKLDKNWEKTTEYAAMYDGGEDDIAGIGGEPDDDEEEVDPSLLEEDGEPVEVDEEATTEHAKNRTKPPKIISASALGDVPAYYEEETFFFYADLGILTDENGNEIPDPETYLGDSLTKYNFDTSDEERIYVINYRLSSVYDVQKVYGDVINPRV